MTDCERPPHGGGQFLDGNDLADFRGTDDGILNENDAEAARVIRSRIELYRVRFEQRRCQEQTIFGNLPKFCQFGRETGDPKNETR